MGSTLNVKTENFKYYTYDVLKIRTVFENPNYKTVKNIIKVNENYMYYLVHLLKQLKDDLFTDKNDFFDHCNELKVVILDFRNKKYDNILLDKLIDSLYKIKSTSIWSDFYGNIVEYIVVCKLKVDSFLVKNEPSIYYKRNNIFKKNKWYSNKKFDILANKKNNYFILAEVKANLTSYITYNFDKSGNKRYRMNKKLRGQIEKINITYNKLNESINRIGRKPKVIRCIFTLHELKVPIKKLEKYKIINLKDFTDANYLNNLF